jgi:GDP-L-fucose synthase
VQKLKSSFWCGQVLVPVIEDYNLVNSADIERMYDRSIPDIVIHLAAVVGGIGANRANPGRYFYENLIMGIQLMEQARRRNITKFVAIGTLRSP